MQSASRKWLPPKKVPTREWLAKYFQLPAAGADHPGPYDPDYVPALWGIFHALDNPADKVVVLMKAAQVGWTYGLVGHIGKRIHTDPSPIIILFPKDGSARDFGDEKFKPAVEATPVLAERIDVSGSRKTGQRANYKVFPGGFLKLVGSNSVSNVKSTPAPLVIVEEPDDTNESVADQGDSIRLVRERLKRYRTGKLVLGGTPSVKGISRVEEHIELSDKRVLPIRCHECGESHVLDWDNVTWLSREDGREHTVYGSALPETALYACPHCGTPWDDWRRQENVRQTVRAAYESGDPYCGWERTTEYTGVTGFQELNELYVCIPGTRLADVVRDHLQAEHDARLGDESGRIVFTNSKLGRPYEYRDENATEDELRAVARDYPELVSPMGGLIVTAGIDVQHNRLAVILRAWGRNEESWLLYWGELPASHSCVDKNDPVWNALDKLLFAAIKHESGRNLFVDAITIDSGDGQTNDAVYHWVRTRSASHSTALIMAGKGSSLQQDPEIFVPPRQKVDHHRPDRRTKADRHGVQVYIVGTNKAKDWIAGQAKIEVQGRGRWHHYRDVRADYYSHLTAEVKAPHKSIRFRRVWQLKSGRSNEGLDCEGYSLHAARGKRVHLLTARQWDDIEQRLLQADLFEIATDPLAPAQAPATPPKSRADIARQLNR